MRSSLLVACSLALAVCGDPLRGLPGPEPTVAVEFVAVYNHWDEPRFSALFAVENPTRAARLRDHFAWLHARLGPCGAPQLLWTTSRRAARWTHTCERGALETWFELDEAGRIVEMQSGATGAPPPEILAAATTIVASLPWPADTLRTYPTNLHRAYARDLGRCTITRPWVHGPRVGIFHLDCTHGAAVLGVTLNRDDGTIARAHMVHGEMYQTPDDHPRSVLALASLAGG